MAEQKNTTNHPGTTPADNPSEAEVAEQNAGVTDKSSEDATSRSKAGKDEGAGGGAKQQQQH